MYADRISGFAGLIRGGEDGYIVHSVGRLHLRNGTICFLFQVFLVELFELVEWNGFRIVVKVYVGGSGDDQ